MEGTIGERIKKLREEKGLTKKELADKCEMPVVLLTSFEKDFMKPKLETALQIARGLKVGFDELIDIDDYPEEEVRRVAKKMVDDLKEVMMDALSDISCQVDIKEENEDSNYTHKISAEVSDDIKITIEGNDADKVLHYYHLMLDIYKND